MIFEILAFKNLSPIEKYLAMATLRHIIDTYWKLRKVNALDSIFVSCPFFTDVVPSEQIIDIGRQARLECLTEDRDRSAVTWMKDGQPLPNHPRLIANRWVTFTKWAFLRSVEVFADLSFKNRLHSFFRQTLQIFNLQREDYGMYQCFVARGNQEAQASSELRLGGMCSSQIFAITLSSKTAQEKKIRAKSIKLEAAAFLNKKWHRT